MAYQFSEAQKEVRRARTKAWIKANPERFKQNQRLHVIRRAEEIRARSNDYRKANQEAITERMRARRLKYPWYDIWQGIKQRCTNPKHPSYYRYGGRGIRNYLTKADITFMWTRDNAATLKQPSIDRRNNDLDYTLDNCAFIELGDNRRKASHQLGKGLLST